MSENVLTPCMEQTEFRADAEFARELDAADPLAGYRDRFHLPTGPDGGDVIYFTGNSLGLMPKTARGYVDEELEDWQQLAIEADLKARHPWLPYHEFLTGQMACIIGAKPIETVVMNSLTVNLHLMMVSFFKPTNAATQGNDRKRRISIGPICHPISDTLPRP